MPKLPKLWLCLSFLIVDYTVSGASDDHWLTTTKKSAHIQGRNATTRHDVTCTVKWSCSGYNYSEVVSSARAYFRTRSCACDPLCLLLEDCCPYDNIYLPLSSAKGVSQHLVVKGTSSPEQGSVGERQTLAAKNEWESVYRASSILPPAQAASARGHSPISSLIPDEEDRSLLHLYRQYRLDKTVFSCVTDPAINAVNSVSMVTTCPAHYQQPEINQMCVNATDDDPFTQIPVSGTATGVLYRNMYCALCHLEPYKPWIVEKNCNQEPSPCSASDSSACSEKSTAKCVISYRPPSDEYRWRPCRSDVISTCSDSFSLKTAANRQTAARCLEGKEQRAVYSTNTPYRNQHCAICAHAGDSLSCEPYDYSLSTAESRKEVYSFNVILDINTITGSEVGMSKTHRQMERNETGSCESGHVFDPFRQACRPVYCLPGMYFIENACMPEIETAVEEIPAKNISINCTFILLNHTEFRLSNGSEPTLQLIDTGVVYLPSEFLVNDKDVYLCVNYSQNFTRTAVFSVEDVVFTFTFPELVVGATGLCISLVALTVTICVYSALRVLQNLPGRNLLSLASALFLADSLFLVAPFAAEEALACIVVATVLHYIYMVFFMWMNVMALDMYLTFSKTFVKAWGRSNSSRRFIFYSCYAWLTPFLFVLPAVLVQVLVPSSPFSPRYGDTLCWLNSKRGLQIFLALPLGFLLVLNLAWFIRAAFNIYRVRRMTACVLGRGEAWKPSMYVKPTVVVGITWILGFVAAVFPMVQELKYCFIVMNSLQGFFICLGFVCTGKVYRTLKRKMCGHSRQYKSSRSVSLDTTLTSLSSSRRKSSAAKLSQV